MRGTRIITHVCVAIGLASVIAVAVASADSPPGVVHACKQKNNGQVRIVSDPSECRPSEEYVALAPGTGAAPGPEAYARVNDGTLDTTRSKNVVSMTKTTRTHPQADPDDPALEVYCFDLTFVPANGVATGEFEEQANPEWFPGSQGVPFAAVAGTDAIAALPCPPTTDAAIVYGHDHPAVTLDDSFYARFTT